MRRADRVLTALGADRTSNLRVNSWLRHAVKALASTLLITFLVAAGRRVNPMANLNKYRTEILAGLFITLVLLAIGSLVGQGILRTEQDAYERGARAAIMHSVCRGSLPTLSYLQRAFHWGDPQTCEEVQQLDSSKTKG
jgi:hypothetical protein